MGSVDPISLNPGDGYTYNMASAAIPETTFYGYVEVSGDQPVAGVITTPNYGMLTGVIYEGDGVTPAQANNVSIYSFPNNDGFGGTHTLSDGSYFIGGLADNDYKMNIQVPYPWANQWFNGQANLDNADIFHVNMGDVYTANVVLQPGGRSPAQSTPATA